MPQPSEAAESGTLDDFLSEYDPELASSWSDSTGRTLLHAALSNADTQARVAIANRLLDDGADAAAVLGAEGVTTVHVLLGNKRHDPTAEAALLARLLDGGADLNRSISKSGTPLHTLARQFKFSDEELAPFYDVIFARDDLDLLSEVKDGRSGLESIRAMAAKRSGLLERAESYVREHGTHVDES